MIRSDNPLTIKLAKKLNKGRSLAQASHELGMSDAQLRLHFINGVRNGYIETSALRRNSDLVENSFPSELESQIELSLSSVNGVLKSTTLLTLDMTPMTADQIMARIVATTGFEPRSQAPISTYCKHSFVPDGVAKADVIGFETRPVSYYSISGTGIKVQHLAAYNLHFFAQNCLMPRDVFGSGNSRSDGSRGAYNALSIMTSMYELERHPLSNSGFSTHEIGAATDIHKQSVAKHLKRLEKAGLCQKKASGSVKYLLTDKGKRVAEHFNELRRSIIMDAGFGWMSSFYSEFLNSPADFGGCTGLVYMLREEAESGMRKRTERGTEDFEAITGFIADYEGTNGGPNDNEISRGTGIPKTTTGTLLKRMAEGGIIVREKYDGVMVNMLV